MQYPILPFLKDREINTFYLFKGKVRFWNGKKLLCKCKNYLHRCKNCSPDGYQAQLDNQRIYRQNIGEVQRKNNREAKRRYRKKIERLYEILL